MGGRLYIVSGKSHFSWYLQIWNINSWDMWPSTHYFSGLLQDLFHVFLYEIQCIYFLFSVVHFFQGTSVFITCYLFEHYQLWMMIVKPKGSSLQKHQNCVCSTLKSATVIILIYVCLYQLWVPKWQVLANRLSLAFAAHFQIAKCKITVFIDNNNCMALAWNLMWP